MVGGESTTEPGLTLRGYAQHRKALRLPGGTLSGVQKAIKRGLPRLPSGRIDPDTADQAWERCVSPDAQVRRRTAVSVEADNRSSADYWASRARREAALAEQAELDLQERRGTLLLASEVTEAVTRMIVEAKTKLLALPMEIAPVVAEESEEGICRTMIETAIRRALTELSVTLGTGSGKGRESDDMHD